AASSWARLWPLKLKLTTEPSLSVGRRTRPPVRLLATTRSPAAPAIRPARQSWVLRAHGIIEPGGTSDKPFVEIWLLRWLCSLMNAPACTQNSLLGSAACERIVGCPKLSRKDSFSTQKTNPTINKPCSSECCS